MHSNNCLAFACAIAALLGISGCSRAPDSTTDNVTASNSNRLVESPDLQIAIPETIVQKSFPDPETGANALADAIRANDRPALATLFGKPVEEIIPEGEVARADVDKFLAAYDKAHRLISTSDKASLVVGTDEWTFPVPLVKEGDSWRFDTAAGEQEMTIRRIGRNELNVIQTALAYYDAQKEYASKDHNDDGILEYAQKILSTQGQRDGLYWPGEGDDPSPLGPLMVEGVVAGEPYHGYRYRILTAQGPNAPGGARNYIIGKRMSGGFGLIAWPAEYNYTGIMTFIVNHDGVVYQKDLGEDTETAAAAITVFDPDNTWKEQKPES